mmetsp:Transcript_9514/g.15853  ORF Transcript_9514/g.15853 Transcript_9514/m.15853 type:complete len:110 (-) Transcript_9514:322-651(-)
MQAPPSYDKLSSQAGVDFDALRAKYQHVAQMEQEKARENPSTTSSEQAEAMKAMQRLDDYNICSRCHGQGTVKELYNHFWQERDCPDCDGEAVVLRQVKDIQASISQQD